MVKDRLQPQREFEVGGLHLVKKPFYTRIQRYGLECSAHLVKGLLYVYDDRMTVLPIRLRLARHLL